MYGADGRENVPHREWLLTVDNVMKEVKADMEKQGRASEFIGVKVCFFRSLNFTTQTYMCAIYRLYIPPSGSSRQKSWSGILRTA